MKLKDFLDYNCFQIIFPEFQDDRIRKFAMSLNRLCGDKAKIIHKASNDRKKISYKNKNVLFIELENKLKGIIGLFLCLQEFEELIELKAIRNLLKYNIPKEFRDLFEEHYEDLKHFNENLQNKNDENDLSLSDLNENLREKLVNLIKQ